MWGNLRSIANNTTREGGIIAKIGDVVAPQSQDEDDEFESESGSGEYEDEDEYEYYEGSENLDDLDDDDNDDMMEEEEGHRMQFSPQRLNEGRAAMGKLFGGVLQKGKEKLSETARNLVEPDYVEPVQQQQQQQQQHERIPFGAESTGEPDPSADPAGGNHEEIRVEQAPEAALSHGNEVKLDAAKSQYTSTSEVEGTIPDLAEKNSMDFLSFGDDDDDISIHDTEEDYFTSDQRNAVNKEVTYENTNTELKNDFVPEQKVEEIVQSDDFVQKEEKEAEHESIVVENGQINDGYKSSETSVQHDDIKQDEFTEENVETEEPKEEDFIEDKSSVFKSIQIDDGEISVQHEEIKPDDIAEEDIETVEIISNDVDKEDEEIEEAEEETASVSDSSKAADQDMTPEAKKEEDGFKEEVSIEEEEESDLVEQDLDSPKEEEQEELDSFNENMNGLNQNLHLNGETGHMMENGNDPSAIEILDETVGHSFNLQETGLDRTIGHHLDIAEQEQQVESPELDYTVGHNNLSLVLNQDDDQSPTSEEQESFESKEVNSEEVEALKQALVKSLDSTERYQAEVSTLQSDLDAAQSAIKKLEEQLFQKDKEYSEQVQELKSSHEKDKEFFVNTAQETHAEEVELAVQRTREEMEKYVLEVQRELATQMEQSDNQLEQFRLMFEEASSRAEKTEALSKKEAAKHSHQIAEMEKRYSIALERVENKAGRAMTALDDKDSQIKELNTIIKDMKDTIKQNAVDHEAVEDEADELHDENEKLKETIEGLENERKQLKGDLKKLQDENGKSLGVQIELQLLREERDREKEKIESLKEAQSSNESNLTGERDAAKAAALDLEQRLAALQADLDLVKSDYERSIMANSNLEAAMEAFQIERESELALLEESRLSAEEAIKNSNELALQSMREENESAMKEVQIASNKAIQNMMSEMSLTEQKLEEYRKETVNLRRSLDEAIHRLQTNQEDVIDRSLMKNILLDWHSKSGKARRDVMVVVASVLHFTEADKDKCGIGPGSSTIEKVVGAVAPPLTPAVKTAEELDGDNIREKWVNFLLAECGDSPKRENEVKSPAAPKMRKSRSSRTTQSLEL